MVTASVTAIISILKIVIMTPHSSFGCATIRVRKFREPSVNSFHGNGSRASSLIPTAVRRRLRTYLRSQASGMRLDLCARAPGTFNHLTRKLHGLVLIFRQTTRVSEAARRVAK